MNKITLIFVFITLLFTGCSQENTYYLPENTFTQSDNKFISIYNNRFLFKEGFYALSPTDMPNTSVLSFYSYIDKKQIIACDCTIKDNDSSCKMLLQDSLNFQWFCLGPDSLYLINRDYSENKKDIFVIEKVRVKDHTVLQTWEFPINFSGINNIFMDRQENFYFINSSNILKINLKDNYIENIYKSHEHNTFYPYKDYIITSIQYSSKVEFYKTDLTNFEPKLIKTVNLYNNIILSYEFLDGNLYLYDKKTKHIKIISLETNETVAEYPAPSFNASYVIDATLSDEMFIVYYSINGSSLSYTYNFKTQTEGYLPYSYMYYEYMQPIKILGKTDYGYLAIEKLANNKVNVFSDLNSINRIELTPVYALITFDDKDQNKLYFERLLPLYDPND